ncbi:MAG: iron-sulfur cluster insertion protein ErpA [candidate division KSB1 bacterium]|nr:iron-sulfur cluster insertion protein ErpA [candidate division KSB1 bacterium]
MITITEKAIDEIRKILEQENEPDLFLRVGVQGGGCSGLSYFLSLDKEIRPQDKILEHDGVKVVVDSKSAMYLEGTILDFTDGLMGRGFVFNNPNAVRTCGCGSSFSV